MPVLRRTPEEIIWQLGHGIYFVSFNDTFAAMLDDREPTGKADFIAWFQQHQPHVCLEKIGPSEFSGFICGGFMSDIYLGGWTEEDIAEYSAAFEDENGITRDRPWEVIDYPVFMYERRLEPHGQPPCD